MEKIRIGNDPESVENLADMVEKTMADVAADYGGTKEDVQRVVMYLLKQKDKAGFSMPIKVPRNEVEERILDAIAKRFEAVDVAGRKKVTTSDGEVLGAVTNKAEAIRLAQEQRDSA